MKIEWLVTDAQAAIGTPGRAECAVLGIFLVGRVFWPIQDIFVVAEPLYDVGTSS